MVLGIALCSPALAEVKPVSATKAQYLLCQAYARKSDAAADRIYIAWMSGLSHYCLLSDQPKNVAKAEALKECEKQIKGFRRTFGVSDPCTIAVERGKIVDRTYERALSLWKPWPIRVTIFDSTTGAKPDVGPGTYFDYPTKFRGWSAVEWYFEVKAEGVLICQGKAAAKSGTQKIAFDVDCFGERFVGSSIPNKVVRSNGLILAAPDRVRIESKGSWIEIDF